MLVKYLLEKILAVFLILTLFIPFYLIILLNYLLIGRPILFFQKRIGIDGNLFVIYKLRTLKSCTKDPNKFEINKWGAFLRKFKIDEVPQLINILKGDMSFVGPRPLLPEYLEIYSTTEKKRHSVRPGLTGLVQISGGNQLTWKQKFELDILYVQQTSILLDIKILFTTFLKYFNGSLQNEKNIVSSKYTGE